MTLLTQIFVHSEKFAAASLLAVIHWSGWFLYPIVRYFFGHAAQRLIILDCHFQVLLLAPQFVAYVQLVV